MTQLKLEKYPIPGARIGPENPLPIFRHPEPDNKNIAVDPSLPPEKCKLLGWQTGWRVLPYRMQDQYTRQKEPLVFQAVTLENDILRAIFLPELGGRLVSLVHKPLNRELLDRNPVFQPANLAIRNAWFSGGVEWNTGQYGHALHTCAPVFAARIRGPEGEPALRIYDYERCKNHFWQIDFFLPPGFPFLLVSARVLNPFNRPSSMYWWTNIAVPETEGTRVLAPAKQAIYMIPSRGLADLPELPVLPGKDATYSLNFPFASEYFFQCEAAEMPWEAVLDRSGAGFIEASTRPLNYRKLFCWGNKPGGRRWQEYLSVPGRAYIEIQAGLAPTQLHGLSMPPRGEFAWMEAMGFIEADPALVHHADWKTAWQAVDRELKKRLPAEALNEKADVCRGLANNPPQDIIHAGSGWGALEIRRRKTDPEASPLPASFIFPESTLGAEQEKWLYLLEKGRLPEQDTSAEPGEWMIQEEWQAKLENSLRTNSNWFALLYAGLMRMEKFDEAGARQAWEYSIRCRPSAWAHRNLAMLALRQKRKADALREYEKAWELASGLAGMQTVFAQEFLQILCNTGEYQTAHKIFRDLPDSVKASDRIQIIRGVIALNLNELEVVENILQREYAVIQESETMLTDLWFGMWEKRLAEKTGRTIDAGLKEEARRLYPPPANIDFRMS